MEHIFINKELIPYTFKIVLYNELFEFRIDYNKTADLFTVSVSKNDVQLCVGEPIVYGIPLFYDLFTRGEFPCVIITPIDPSGDFSAVTFDNLSSTVLLKVTYGGDDE